MRTFYWIAEPNSPSGFMLFASPEVIPVKGRMVHSILAKDCRDASLAVAQTRRINPVLFVVGRGKAVAL